jgi:hypothetical protein
MACEGKDDAAGYKYRVSSPKKYNINYSVQIQEFGGTQIQENASIFAFRRNAISVISEDLLNNNTNMYSKLETSYVK